MSNLVSDDEATVQTTVNPDGTTTRVVHAAPSRAGYWIAGLVAVVAIIAVAYMVVSRNNQTADANATQAAVSNAYQQGQTQGQIDAASQLTAAQQAAAAQTAQAQAAQSQAAAAQASIAQSADAANRAAARAQRAADRSADTPPPSDTPQ
ncbi:MAG TPA: hypothetical protein VGL66_00925 [Caulobacteraceae bacterium]|jgi:hypothetical protein